MLENLWLVEPGVVVICHNPKQLGRDICLFFLLWQFNFNKRYMLFLELFEIVLIDQPILVYQKAMMA